MKRRPSNKGNSSFTKVLDCHLAQVKHGLVFFFFSCTVSVLLLLILCIFFFLECIVGAKSEDRNFKYVNILSWLGVVEMKMSFEE